MLPFHARQTHSSCAFKLIRIYLFRPYRTKTHVGHRYFLRIVDNYTRAILTHPMLTKDEVMPLIKSFIVVV